MGRGYKSGSGQHRMTPAPWGRRGSRKIYRSGGTDFVKDGVSSLTKQEVVFVDVSKLDKAWKKGGPALYIPRGGGGAAIPGRREGFRDFRKTGKPVEMSRVYIDKNGKAVFSNGRHRFSIYRDQGRKVIPVAVDRGAAARRLREVAGA